MMIGLSIAVARFVEALFWAILRVAGGVAALAVIGFVAVVAIFLVGRRWLRKR